ncbi:WXG100 family type VII secretion target [Nocardia acidivorans]|uniref:WXG100 family type VII secretion target n=1 Tax=Nocardia acidivorans TaxID=404580 RepID=UPI000834ECB0|nr:hypothetical protein [Nocardia acidivorans]
MGDTDNPWRGLAQQARGGTLNLGDGVGQAAAKIAADVANTLGIALTYQPLLTEHKGFGDHSILPSAMHLEDRFNAQGKNLGGVLKRYIDLVEAMADTMIVADHNYKVTEEDSKAEFDRFKKESPVQPPAGDPKLVSGTKLPVWHDDSAPPLDGKHGNADLVKIAREKGHYDSLDPEDPNGKDRVWLHAAGEGMNPQLVSDIGGTWLLVADKVDKSFDQLTKQLDKMKDGWTGRGGDAARRVAGEFKTEAAGLTADMRAMASNLTYVSGWLDNTKVRMPSAPTDFDYDHPAREDRIVKAARQAFQNFYVNGMIAGSKAIPHLVDPLAQLPGVDAKGRTTTDDGGGGGTTKPQNKLGLSGASIPANQIDPRKSDPNGKTPQGKGPNGNDPNKTDPGKNGSDDPRGKTDPSQTDPSRTDPNTTDPGQSSSNGTSQQSSSGSSDASQLSSALQQGLQTLNSANQQKTTDPSSTLASLPNMLNNLKDLKDLKDIAKGGGPGGGGPGISAAAAPKELTAKLFPRAALSAEVEGAIATSSRAGIATGGATPMGSGMGGAPMGGGHGAGGAGGQGKEHKRPEFLDSSEYLEEAMGAPPIVAKPVVEG